MLPNHRPLHTQHQFLKLLFLVCLLESRIFHLLFPFWKFCYAPYYYNQTRASMANLQKCFFFHIPSEYFYFLTNILQISRLTTMQLLNLAWIIFQHNKFDINTNRNTRSQNMAAFHRYFPHSLFLRQRALDWHRSERVFFGRFHMTKNRETRLSRRTTHRQLQRIAAQINTMY